VTIIAGFQCVDGILICSDTEQSWSSTSKSQVKKVPLYQLGKMTIGVGGAGDGSLCDFVAQDLAKYLVRTSYDWKNIEAGLNAYAQNIFSQHVMPYASFPVESIPDISFLIAITMDGEAHLFKWERNFLYAIPPMHHTAIGIGIVQAEQLLSEIQFYYPYEQMLFFATRMMYKVKQLVQGCGGKTEVVFLNRNSGHSVHWGIFPIDEVEHVTMMVDEFLTDHVMSFIANTTINSPQSIDQHMKMIRGGIEKMRSDYLELMPGFKIKEIKPSISEKSEPEQ
jgi:hypothetical protein